MPIQHLRLNQEPLLNDQYFRDLGKVNILTGKNSSGKTTILNSIMYKPNSGFTFKNNVEFFRVIIDSFISKANPGAFEVVKDDFTRKIFLALQGQNIFAQNGDELKRALQKAQQNSPGGSLNLEDDINKIVENLLGQAEKVNPILLSPKRRFNHHETLIPHATLNEDAGVGLSRLFFLKNEPLYEHDHELYKKIFDSFKDITNCEFDIQMVPPNVPPEIQLRFKRPKGGWILAKDEGQGLREILTMILYALDGEYNLVLLEEPENHLHPDFQRRLLTFLNTLENRQFIISTHSTIFLNTSLVDQIYLSRFENDKITISENKNRVDAFSELGFLATDNLVSDAIIMTEGKNDAIFFDYILKNWFGIDNRFFISYLLLGGSMMAYFDPTPFAQVRNAFALLDEDPKDEKARKTFIERCKAQNLPLTKLIRYSLENYYSLKALRSVFGALIKPEMGAIDEKVPLWESLADENHDGKWWEGELKSARKIQKILRAMTLDDIKGTDFHDFCNKIKITLENSSVSNSPDEEIKT